MDFRRLLRGSLRGFGGVSEEIQRDSDDFRGHPGEFYSGIEYEFELCS